MHQVIVSAFFRVSDQAEDLLDPDPVRIRAEIKLK